jgi:hypothetical protein
VQVLGQCKGVVSAVVSVLCFHNIVPVVGWMGYSFTVFGCLLYGRCKVRDTMNLMNPALSCATVYHCPVPETPATADSTARSDALCRSSLPICFAGTCLSYQLTQLQTRAGQGFNQIRCSLCLSSLLVGGTVHHRVACKALLHFVLKLHFSAVLV